MFLVKLDSNGNAPWAISKSETVINGITSDLNGNIFTTGRFGNDTTVFGADTLFPYAFWDMFIAKISYGNTSIFENTPKNSLHLSPNPTTSTVQLTLPKGVKGYVEVINIVGKRVYSQPAPLSSKGEPAHMEIDVTAWAKGMYVVRVGNENRKLIVE
jgi:hypothetical protein